jgi:hypothetical protein
MQYIIKGQMALETDKLDHPRIYGAEAGKQALGEYGPSIAVTCVNCALQANTLQGKFDTCFGDTRAVVSSSPALALLLSELHSFVVVVPSTSGVSQSVTNATPAV